jgi:hypothetical protein
MPIAMSAAVAGSGIAAPSTSTENATAFEAMLRPLMLPYVSWKEFTA